MCPSRLILAPEGGDIVVLYIWSIHTARNNFCKICGVYTFRQRRTDPPVYGIDMSCLDHLDLAAF